MKIAFCLMGIVGADYKHGQGQAVDYRIGHHFHNKHIFEANKDHDIDVFLHSWSKEFEEEIVETYRPRRYLFEDQIDFYQNNIRLNAIKSRWYSTKAVMKLKSQCEDENNFKYDFVMVYRFDHIFLRDLIFPDFDTNYFYAAHRDDCSSNQCRCIITNRFYDAWFFGNSEDMDKYSSLYDFWEDYGIRDPHAEVVHHINQMGLNKRLKHIFYEKVDFDNVRAKIKNCEYTNREFNVDDLEWFSNYPKKRF
jgi:hypothetical protein